jgi:hypothetical protein
MDRLTVNTAPTAELAVPLAGDLDPPLSFDLGNNCSYFLVVCPHWNATVAEVRHGRAYNRPHIVDNDVV